LALFMDFEALDFETKVRARSLTVPGGE